MDSGYLPGVVEAVEHKAGGTAMVLSKGVGITAGRKPMSAYRRKPGETHGHHWYFPSIRRSGEFPHVLVDTNPDISPCFPRRRLPLSKNALAASDFTFSTWNIARYAFAENAHRPCQDKKSPRR